MIRFLADTMYIKPVIDPKNRNPTFHMSFSDPLIFRELLTSKTANMMKIKSANNPIPKKTFAN